MPPTRQRTPPSTDSAASPDDAAGGRALRWSVTTLFLVLASILLLYLLNHETAPRPTPSTAADSAPTSATPPPSLTPARFTDITRTAGIQFQHHNGARGEKLLPETMGAGCAFVDIDNDADPDLIFVNGADWPWNTPSNPSPSPALYLNDGHGRFTDVTQGSGLDQPLYGMGIAAGDFDNDGYTDLYLTGVGQCRLLRNLGNARFQDVTQSAGVGSSPEDWATSAAFFDLENDGDLDLFVCHYVRWSRQIDLEVDYRLVGVGRAYGPPMNFPGSFPKLYRNDGAGRFTDISASSGIQIRNRATGLPMAKSLGVAPVDIDNDGFMDLIVANDTVQNFVFTNRHDATFTEIGARSGIAFDNYGGARGAMGVDTARFQDDDTLGISIGNFANEMTAFYVAQRDRLTFTDEAIPRGIGPASRLSLTFGVFFFDYDLDGRLDLLTANGHIDEDIQRVQTGQRYRQPLQLFWNAHGEPHQPGFVPVPDAQCSPDLLQPLVGRGSAYADIDGDGDLDAVITQTGGPPLLLRNDLPPSASYLRLRLIGVKTNRDAIGAWVRLRSSKRILWRNVMPTRGYLSQSELPVTFGLAPGERIEELDVIWPGGKRQRIPTPPRLPAVLATEES